MNRIFSLIVMLAFLTAVSACTSAPVSSPTPSLIVPTAANTIAANPTPSPNPTIPPALTIMPSATPATTATATAVPATDPPAPDPPPTTTSVPDYRVAFVAPNDYLNVRSGPGVENDIVGELGPTAAGLKLMEDQQEVIGSIWYEIDAGNVTGWVNGRYLTQNISADEFCQDDGWQHIVGDLEAAIMGQDSSGLTQLIHPEKGLKIHMFWWNDEVIIDDASNIFTSSQTYTWGTQMGEGGPWTGTFAEVVNPKLVADYVNGEEMACNEILHGGTAGWVRLPDGHEQVNYFSLYRPGTEEYGGLDWGAWAVGVEMWQGEYYLSYLVYFQWEI